MLDSIQPVRTQFATTSRGLDRSLPPMRLFAKAKKLGVWNPDDIDLTTDKQHWDGFTDLEKEVLLHVTSLFLAGEEAVTLDLLPLIMTIAKEGRLEEEMFLTTFLWEEAKHVDFFTRFIENVVIDPGDLTRFEGDDYRRLFHDKLPSALQALQTDPSPEAQVRASVTYNMIVEGVLAETGYHGYYTAVGRLGLLPGMQQGIYKLKQDESRHIAYGVYLLSRLISAEPKLWKVAEETMNDLLPLAMGVISDIFMRYETMPFGLELPEFANYALSQFNKRINRIEKARDSSFEEVVAQTQQIIDADDA